MHPFLTLLNQRFTYFDGGFGTTLQAMGLQGGEQPEHWNLTHPQEVRSVYLGYLRAGSDMVAANTFGANPLHFPNDWEAILRAGVGLAREAVAEVGRGYVALDAGSVGKLLKPLGELEFETAVAIYRDMALVAIDAGCDLLLAETMTDLREIKAAVLGYREALGQTGAVLPVLVSMSFDVNGRLLTGADIEGAAALLTSMQGVDALGMNCGREPKALLPNLKRLIACADGKPVFFMPNASVPTLVNGQTVFATQPEEFAADMAEAARMGARGLGGCCGTNTAHIAALVAATKDMPFPQTPPADADGLAPTYVSGRSGTVTLGPRPVVIGERLNPTGKKRMKQALRDGDIDYLLGEATAQLDAGADTLDVNVGLPELNEAEMLPLVVEAVQGVAGVPLQLDTADPKALESALRVYVGKPIINSVNGKRHIMDEVFPLVKKYGGALVCLVLDEDGIPATAEGRMDIARRIAEEADRYGIPRRDLLFDALTMTVATDPNAARITLETVRRLHDELRVKTVLGISNVSFGLPKRAVITSAFLAMALEHGLTAAILNPLDEGVRAAFEGASAALGFDVGFEHYLARYAGGDAEPATKQQVAQADVGGAQADAAREAIRLAGEAIRRAEAALQVNVAARNANTGCGCAACSLAMGNAEAVQPDGAGSAQSGGTGTPAQTGSVVKATGGAQENAALFQAIVRGLTKVAVENANALMDGGAAPLSVVEGGVILALSEVGARYERGEFFLPQLMQSANAAKQAIAAATARMGETKPSTDRTVLLATVHGDVHDIGKNIVATLLGSYGFGVIDLGRDVAPEAVLAAARESGVRLVGLSALMTTTVPAMRQTVELLRKELPEVRVMVGGAVLTESLAKELGADGYAADAMGAVRYAGEVLG
ncbi:MAG TPA: homocysteine S-methyltransferase family protein [Candidatus Limiplasma sp.]|nr:homocysteine S-methyltransferase family protein [Candidatus Limiplasma sp.]